MRTLVVDCPPACPPLLDDALWGRAAIEGLLAAAPLPRVRPGAVLLFRSQAALDRSVAGPAWTSAGLAATGTGQYDVPAVVPDRPLFIVGVPRSGTTLLMDVLKAVPAFWTIGGEGLGIYDANPAIRAPSPRPSHRLVAADATPEVAGAVRAGFVAAAHNRYGTLLVESPPERRPASLRLLEKTPRNALRIPFVHAIFPDARFIYLYRDPRENIASLIEGWKSARFVIHREGGRVWSFLMPPGWRDFLGGPVADVAAFQWRAANTCIMNDLEAIPRARWCVLRFADFLASPGAHAARLCAFAGAAPGPALAARLARPLPLSRSTLTPPHPDKWRVHARDIERVWDDVQPVAERALQLANAGDGDVRAPAGPGAGRPGAGGR